MNNLKEFYKRIYSLFVLRYWRYWAHSYSNSNLNAKNDQELVKSYIDSKQPFLIARIGGTEHNNLLNDLGFKFYKRNFLVNKALSCISFLPFGHKRYKDFSNLYELSGVYPMSEEIFNDFIREYSQGCNNIDVLATWLRGEKFFVSIDKKNLISLKGLSDPFLFNNPWSQALINKKVLIIHPFIDTIYTQYINFRSLLFPYNTTALPEFELIPMKAIQSLFGASSDEFDSWTLALSSMKNQIRTLDFDLALIGAGAYGIPLGSYIKDLGKQAIVMGGSLQLLFGIRGRRWDKLDQYKTIFNEHWTYPSGKEILCHKELVEDSCYWK